MQLKEVKQEDVLTNLLVKSKSFLEKNAANHGNHVKYDYKLNYNKVYDNPKEYEISYVDALANLEQINELFRKRISERNPNYNFFLDDSPNPSVEVPIDQELYEQYKSLMDNREGELFTYTLNNTWTKGKDFFFVKKGTVMKVQHIHEDRVFADVAYQGQVGLMKMEELKIIVSEYD